MSTNIRVGYNIKDYEKQDKQGLRFRFEAREARFDYA